MKVLMHIITVFTFLILYGCGQGQLKTPENAMSKFEEFKKIEKFNKDEYFHYAGVGNPLLKPILNKYINLAAEDFENLAKKENSTEKDYQNAIKKSLDRFSEIYIDLDTEDRERVCFYFEQLMDIVGLESSDGHLNEFMYGFDPTKK